MSRKHPQNGPSLNKPTHKKSKPLTDEDLAERQAKEKKRGIELTQSAREAREFSAKVKAFGGSIPLRGPRAEEFWGKRAESPKNKRED